MAGYSHSIDLAYGAYSVDPNIGNFFNKNGVMLAIPFAKLNAETSWLPGADLQLFVTDTRFVGTKLYENDYQEFGFSVGSSQLRVIGHALRIGASYINAEHSTGFTANFGFTF